MLVILLVGFFFFFFLLLFILAIFRIALPVSRLFFSSSFFFFSPDAKRVMKNTRYSFVLSDSAAVYRERVDTTCPAVSVWDRVGPCTGHAGSEGEVNVALITPGSVPCLFICRRMHCVGTVCETHHK